MAGAINCDVCIIGAGSAGLSAAAGLAQLGLETVLIESGEMGGDCLNTGCVPSKALLSLAKRRHVAAGVHPAEVEPAPREAINAYVSETIAAIAPHDSQERFEGMGVTVIRECARFESPTRVMAGDTAVEAKRFVIATGSSAAIPPIAGLEPGRVLTNETIFSLEETPEHLVVIGGGPIGLEMAQAHRRLGSRVTVLEMRTVLPKDDPELVDVVRRCLKAEGIEILENVEVRSVEHLPGGHRVRLSMEGAEHQVAGSHLLVAAGRKVNVDGLGLEAAGVEYDRKGIRTDRRLRTSRKHIHAIGDVAGGPQFTHVAGYHAGILVRNIAFRIPAKVDYDALPWVTYTDPELAHVGLTLEAARERHGDGVRSFTHAFTGLDRAVAERRREGLLKVVARPDGRILGCSIVGPGAGELIALWGLAISRKLKLKALTDVIFPYPTISEVSRQAAGEWYKPSLFNDRTRRLVSLLQRLPGF
ncbi:dihydrolipoyl dehydrogenase family protein [Lutibaculum baratangense]|uniref:Mercuric ion reductase n=1 Tax=Lutibaculum baratangense AMV1 TaxID=631454 RepID=V4TEL2_9HYPH|nr:FAD-dependent oxidoreductase [Lutibaculum baratangense]ESR24633.1 Mercuric ion reductase [Lutibaculum baratangense AMV1]